MAGSRGLKRLAFFVVFLIPVAWYLFLQLFGDNRFSLGKAQPVSAECMKYEAVTVLVTHDSLSASQLNHYNRVKYRASFREIPILLENGFLDCMNLDADLVLIDEDGLWGSYELSREGVDRLLTEMDVLLMQRSYNEGVSR